MIEAAVVAAAAIAALALVDGLARRLRPERSLFVPGLAPRTRTAGRPAQLVRVESVVHWSSRSAADAQTRLRPVLVDIATARLARRDLTLDDPEVPALLGPAAWSWVRPDRPAPRATAPGPGREELEAVLDALERL